MVYVSLCVESKIEGLGVCTYICVCVCIHASVHVCVLYYALKMLPLFNLVVFSVHTQFKAGCSACMSVAIF